MNLLILFILLLSFLFLVYMSILLRNRTKLTRELIFHTHALYDNQKELTGVYNEIELKAKDKLSQMKETEENDKWIY